MGITIGVISLDKVRAYKWRKQMTVAIKKIPHIPDAGQLVDKETYAYRRPEYEIEARVTNTARDRIARYWQDHSIESYNDGINTDNVQIVNYRWRGQAGHDEHIVRISLLGSSV